MDRFKYNVIIDHTHRDTIGRIDPRKLAKSYPRLVTLSQNGVIISGDTLIKGVFHGSYAKTAVKLRCSKDSRCNTIIINGNLDIRSQQVLFEQNKGSISVSGKIDFGNSIGPHHTIIESSKVQNIMHHDEWGLHLTEDEYNKPVPKWVKKIKRDAANKLLEVQGGPSKRELEQVFIIAGIPQGTGSRQR